MQCSDDSEATISCEEDISISDVSDEERKETSKLPNEAANGIVNICIFFLILKNSSFPMNNNFPQRQENVFSGFFLVETFLYLLFTYLQTNK